MQRLEQDAEGCVVRAAACQQLGCGVVVDLTLGQDEGCDWIEASFLEGVETPVEHTLVLAPAGPLNELLLHNLFFGSQAQALNGRRD